MAEDKMLEKCGVADVPCGSLASDSLEVGSYVKGLEQFVLNCPTPMSIALQGDWGTGKTSFLQAMQSDFKETNSKVKTIYFNTWQYSQFKMSDNLYASFISNIVNALGEDVDDNAVLSTIKEFGKNIFKISSRLAKNAVKETIKIDIDELEGELAQKELEKAESIKSLKENFAKIVDKSKGEDGRVVIFVDDLDRLNPEIAVELLEVMKLFMDVPNCVFVLAIDYEVVVNGVRKKFGNDMSEEKCRSFFDKIIQLPFSMPVGSYKIDKMLEDVLGDIVKDYIGPLGSLVKNSLGANPRTIKRLANSFFLLRIVEKNISANGKKETNESLDAALLFVSLVIQMYSYDAYMKLTDIDESDFINIFKEYGAKGNRKEAEEGEEDSKVGEILALVDNVLKEIAGIANIKENAIYKEFAEAMNLSSITSVAKVGDKENAERKKAMKVTKINLFGQEYAIKNPTYAQIKTYEEILLKNTDCIEKFMEAYPRILTKDKNRKDGFFRALKDTKIESNGEKIYIGTSSSSADKLVFTRALCEFVGVESGQIIWYDGEEVVFKY